MTENKTSDTKTRILDAAERLFAEHGYAATSLRNVIGEAAVNLAAIHYHFGSKEELLAAVVLRKAASVNTERLRRLDAVEAAASGRPPLEDVLRAFLEPTFQALRDSPEMVRLMGRLYGEGGVLPDVLHKYFGPLVARFGDALRRALPELPEEEFAWRIHFAVGAMAHALRAAPLAAPAGPPDPERDCARLVAFLNAGFRAPVPAPSLQEEMK